MSAVYYLKYRGQYVRCLFREGKAVIEVAVARNFATPFPSEADAFATAYRHRLREDWCEVVSSADAEKFTNTETRQLVTLPPEDEAGASPKGLGRDGHKPLMRNRTANEAPSPRGNTGGNIFP